MFFHILGNRFMFTMKVILGHSVSKRDIHRDHYSIFNSNSTFIALNLCQKTKGALHQNIVQYA